VQDRFPPGSFRREDEAPDSIFYREPRLVTHIDDYAIEAVGDAYRRFLPPDGEYLDLMSSWVSHVPSDLKVRRLVGHGMNAEELARNPRLAEWFVQDLNEDPALPFEDARFDGAMICVSVQYLTRPVEVFAEVGRVLRPGAPVIVTYSNRCFPTKAVRIWLALDDADRGRLVATYVHLSDRFEAPEIHDLSPRKEFYSDPLFAVVARGKADAPRR
jgi:SAM-dependent methyltransferase